MDIVSGATLFKTIADAGRKIAEVAKDVKDYETKQKLGEVQDTLISLKQQVSDLEDDNRELKEQLRFKSDDFEFKMPFYYEKTHPERALCPKCFTDKILAPVAELYEGAGGTFRCCLRCGSPIRVSRETRYDSGYHGGGSDLGPWS
jgi:hypothetical protein